MPNFNEMKNLMLQVKKMKALNVFNIVDAVMCDADSTNGSNNINFLKAAGFSALLIRRGSGRYSTDMRMGYAWAINNDYEGFISVDCNNKDDTAAMPDFIARLDESYDYIQGSMFLKSGNYRPSPMSRILPIKFIMSPLLSVVLRRCVTDASNGFKAYSKRFLTDKRVNPFRDAFYQYELTYYLPVAAGRLKFKTVEIPVTRTYPIVGKIPTHVTAKDNVRVMGILIRLLGNHFIPKMK